MEAVVSDFRNHLCRSSRSLPFLFYQYLKLKSSMARSLSVENLVPRGMWGQLSTTCSNATEVTQWGALSCSLPQATTDYGVRDGRSNWPIDGRSVTPHLTLGSTPWAPVEMRATNRKTCCTHMEANMRLWVWKANALPVRALRGLSVGTRICSAYCRCGRTRDLYSGRISSLILYLKLLAMNPS